MVVTVVRPGWWDQLALIYDRKVPDAQVKKDLAELARQARWEPDNVQITHERGGPGGPVMTSVDFVARAVDPRTHSFPLEPIVLTFRRFRRVGAVFMVPPDYPYWGPLRHQRPGVAMRGEKAQGSYTFHFTITDPKVEGFKVPIRNPSAPAPDPEPKSNPRQLLLRLAAVVGLALALSGIVYGIASYLRNRA